ncbi:MAG TPA: CsgG/HfaB family protein [Phycisphaerae bacterium]|nr:CsgG/HfaB family protein [Phycisphaerae bacterium]
MKTRLTIDRFAPALAAAVLLAVCTTGPAAPNDTPNPGTRPATQPAPKDIKPLRPIRVAIFDLQVLKGVNVAPEAVTDQLNTMLAEMPQVTIVNRDEIKKVADEHKMALAGLVDNASAVKLGKFLSAQYVVVGRVSRIGETVYVVVKMIDVETTVQGTIAVKGPAEEEFERLLHRLSGSLRQQVLQLQKPVVRPDDVALARLRKAAEPLAGKVVLVSVEESHVGRPLKDPAAQMAAANRLRSLGFETVVLTDPRAGWKRELLLTGRYEKIKVDYLLEGEGTSAFAATIQDLVSCRARVELRLIPLPGRRVTVTEKGVGAKVDLVEALAAKAALEEAARQAADAVVARMVADLAKAEGNRGGGGEKTD